MTQAPIKISFEVPLACRCALPSAMRRGRSPIEGIEFQTLDPARGTWGNQVSHPHQSSPYTMSPGVTSGKIRIATTNRGYVEYDVQARGAYSIVWNRQSGMWDVRTRRDG